MNIIKKKMAVKNNLPGGFYKLPPVLMSAQLKIADYLQQNTGHEIDIRAMSEPEISGLYEFDELDLPKKGAVFAIGNNDYAVPIFIKICANMTRDLVAGKLAVNSSASKDKAKSKNSKSKKNEKGAAEDFTFFDLLLVQKPVSILTKDLAIRNNNGEFDILARSEHVQSVKAAKTAKWLKLEFSLPLKQTNNGEKHAFANPYKLTLYMTEFLAENILQNSNQLEENIIDPDCPWYRHLQEVVKSSQRQVQIVIEDLHLSVAECTRLQIGQIISLPGASHEKVMIKTARENNPGEDIILAAAKLGVFKSNKAVKLSQDIGAEFWAGFDDLSEQ